MATLGEKQTDEDVSLWPEIVGAAGLTAVRMSAGTTSNLLSAMTFSNSNGVSFGINASVLTAQHNAITTGMASNRGSDFVQATAAFAGTSASGTIASGGISVNVGPYITTGMLSNRGSDFVQAAAAFAGTSASGTIASGGLSVSIGPYITTGALSNHSHGNPTLALTNLTGTTASASNGFTLSLSAGAAGGGVVSNALQDVSTATGSGTNTSRFAADDHVHRGVRGIIADGTASTFFGNFVLSAGANITLSTGGNSTAGSIQIVGPSPGGAGPVQSYFQWPDEIGTSSAWQVSGSTKHLQPICIPYAVSVSFIRFPLSLAAIGSMASIATAANQTIGVTISSTFQLAFYTQGAGASSRSLQYYTTASAAWVQQARISAVGTGSHWSSGHTISYPVTGGTSEFTSSAQTTLSNRTINTTQLSNFTAFQFLDIPLAASFAAGNYWMAFNSSTTNATSVSTQISTVRILASNVVLTQPAHSINVLGSASNSSNLYRIGLGMWSTNSIGTTTSSIGLAGISRSASNPVMAFEMIRQA